MGPCCSDRDQNPAVTPSTLPTAHTGTGALALPQHPAPAGLPARLRPPLPRLRPCRCTTSWSLGPNGSWGARQEGGCSPRLLLRSSSSSSSPWGPAWVIGALGMEVKHGGCGSEAQRFPKRRAGPSTPPAAPNTQGKLWLRAPMGATGSGPGVPRERNCPVPTSSRHRSLCPGAGAHTLPSGLRPLRSLAQPGAARPSRHQRPDPAVSPPARVQPGWLGHGHCCGMIHCSPEQMYGCLHER